MSVYTQRDSGIMESPGRMSSNQICFAKSILEIYQSRSLKFLYRVRLNDAIATLNQITLGTVVACMIADLNYRGMDIERFASKWLQLFDSTWNA